jgi:hypothetical protein
VTAPDPDILRAVRQVEADTRDRLIELAATECLTPAEIERARSIESNWKADQDEEAERLEAGEA